MRNLLATTALIMALQSVSAEAWPGCLSCNPSSSRTGPPDGVMFAKGGGMGGGRIRPSGGGMGGGCGGMGCQGGGGMGGGSGGGMGGGGGGMGSGGGGGMGGGWNPSGGWTSPSRGGTANCPPKSSQRPKHSTKPIPPPGACDTGF
jgi:hypothetical protein